MVIEIDKKANSEDFRHSLLLIRENRTKTKRGNLSKYFGALPNIGDGMEFQIAARNEWN